MSGRTQGNGSIADDAVRSAVQYFAGRVAHDLNNLLTPMMAYPDMLAPYISDESGLRFLEAIEASAQSAIKFSERLAELSGMIRGTDTTIDPAEIVSKVLKTYEDAFADKRIQITKMLTYGGEVRIHRDVLVMAIHELLDNTLSSIGISKVVVSLEHAITDCVVGMQGRRIPPGRYWKLVIRDNGQGMDNAFLPDCQEPFKTGENRKTASGAGLGLSIAYSILANFGCHLVLENSSESGVVATVYMPEASSPSMEPTESSAGAEEPPEKSPEGGKADIEEEKLRVLVVDDERSIVNLFKMILENFIKGIQVDKAENGADAVAQFQKWQQSVLVMDLHMPVMDGQAAFFEIKSLCQSKGWEMPPVIFCTGYAPRDALKQAIEHDERHLLLNKPVQSDVLVKAVKQRLGV